jgi:hypothetical protein
MTDHEPKDASRGIIGQSRLTVVEDRLGGLAASAAPVHALLSTLDGVELGDTAPAMTFNPSLGQDRAWNPTS